MAEYFGRQKTNDNQANHLTYHWYSQNRREQFLGFNVGRLSYSCNSVYTNMRWNFTVMFEGFGAMEKPISRLQGIEKKRLFLMELKSGISNFNSFDFFPSRIANFTKELFKQETLRKGIWNTQFLLNSTVFGSIQTHSYNHNFKYIFCLVKS